MRQRVGLRCSEEHWGCARLRTHPGKQRVWPGQQCLRHVGQPHRGGKLRHGCRKDIRQGALDAGIGAIVRLVCRRWQCVLACLRIGLDPLGALRGTHLDPVAMACSGRLMRPGMRQRWRQRRKQHRQGCGPGGKKSDGAPHLHTSQILVIALAPTREAGRDNAGQMHAPRGAAPRPCTGSCGSGATPDSGTCAPALAVFTACARHPTVRGPTAAGLRRPTCAGARRRRWPPSRR